MTLVQVNPSKFKVLFLVLAIQKVDIQILVPGNVYLQKDKFSSD